MFNEEGRIVLKGYGDITDDVKKVLEKRQVLAAKAGGERFFVQGREGAIGATQFQVDPVIYHKLAQKFGGYDKTWRDPEWVKFILKRCESMRVTNRSRNARVRSPGIPTGVVDTAPVAPRAKRFHKVYEFAT
jgi:hypothetical protein